MSILTEKLRAEYVSLDADSSSFRSTCDEIEQYIMPRVGTGSSAHKGGTTQNATWRDPDVWDFTAPVALTKLAAHIHTSVTPPGLRWAGLDFADKEARENQEATEILEGNTDVLFKEIEESDFNGEMSSAYQEYVGLGNAVFISEVDERPGRWSGFDFQAVPIREVEFTEDSRGRMNKFFRHLRWTAPQILDRCGDKNLPEAVRSRLTDPNASTKPLDVIFAIFPREDVLKRAKKDTIAAPEARPYGYVYFLLESGEQVGLEGGYYDFPAFVARWERTPGSRWGHGLGHLALPGVKGTNAFLELVLTQQALAVDPPSMTTERGLLSDLDRRPGGLTVVENIENSLAPLDGNLKRFDVASVSLEEQRAEIRRLFREDFLELKESPQMTATEAQIRYDIMLKQFGPTVARLMSEFLTPMLEGSYRALFRAGKLDPIPKINGVDAPDLRINFFGAIARARRTDDVASIERGAAFVAGLQKMGFRRAALTFDDEAAAREVFKLLGTSAGVLRSKAEVDRMMKAEQAMAERQMAAEASAKEGQALASLAKVAPAASGGFGLEPSPALTPGGQVAP